MTENVISAHSFKIKFPEFASQPSTRIELAIEEAALSIDTSWGDYQLKGMLYMTAHIIMREISRAASATGQEIASESFAGVLTVAYKSADNAASKDVDDELSTTFYGVIVRDLMGRIFPAVAII